jgi:hypothetical protein
MEDIGGAEDDWLKPGYIWMEGQSDHLECHLNGNFLGPQGVHQDVFTITNLTKSCLLSSSKSITLNG